MLARALLAFVYLVGARGEGRLGRRESSDSERERERERQRDRERERVSE